LTREIIEKPTKENNFKGKTNNNWHKASTLYKQTERRLQTKWRIEKWNKYTNAYNFQSLEVKQRGMQNITN